MMVMQCVLVLGWGQGWGWGWAYTTVTSVVLGLSMLVDDAVTTGVGVLDGVSVGVQAIVQDALAVSVYEDPALGLLVPEAVGDTVGLGLGVVAMDGVVVAEDAWLCVELELVLGLGAHDTAR